MIHRDKITVQCRRTGSDDTTQQVLYGTVVTEDSAPPLTPAGSLVVMIKIYRLVFPANLDLTAARDVRVFWQGRAMRLDTAITPHYRHGRVHHYEAVTRAS